MERDSQSQRGNRQVRPRVQRPLSAPSPLPGVGKWRKIWNRPLIPIRPSRANEIAQQVKVKAHADQRCRKPSFRCQRETDRRHDQTETYVVPKDVMILRPPHQWTSGAPSRNFSDKPKPVDIRDNARNGNGGTLAPVQVRRIRRDPANEEVRDRTHAWLSAEESDGLCLIFVRPHPGPLPQERVRGGCVR